MPTQGAVAQSVYDPWPLQQRIGLTDARLALDSVLMPRPNLSYIDYRSGVMASGDTAGVGGSSHMAMRVKPGSGVQVTVEMGNAVINTPGQGAYMAALDSVKTLPLVSASSTANRIDLIVARIYDDLNSAIGSPSGTRKFTVEVLTGDNSTGTPVQPTPTYGGYTPLAAVYVAKNATSIGTADITDLRGPGLVARGGMRSLYGNDAKTDSAAFAEPGAYPGDQRWCHTNGFQHQVYYGDGPDPTRSGWRGVHNCMVYSSNPAPGETAWIRGLNATAEMCRVTIPYPGTPFMIYPTARCFVYMSQSVATDFRITLGSTGGATVNWVRELNFGTNVDKTHVVGIPPLMYGPFTSSTAVVLSGANREVPYPEAGFGFRGNDVGQTLLSVAVYPSTVQPPSV